MNEEEEEEEEISAISSPEVKVLQTILMLQEKFLILSTSLALELSLEPLPRTPPLPAARANSSGWRCQNKMWFEVLGPDIEELLVCPGVLSNVPVLKFESENVENHRAAPPPE
eukprot:286580-Hanusia_phi.AAC.3